MILSERVHGYQLTCVHVFRRFWSRRLERLLAPVQMSLIHQSPWPPTDACTLVPCRLQLTSSDGLTARLPTQKTAPVEALRSPGPTLGGTVLGTTAPSVGLEMQIP